MASEYEVEINMPMVEALQKLIRGDTCPCCLQTLDYHSRITLNQKGKIVRCSNVGKVTGKDGG